MCTVSLSTLYFNTQLSRFRLQEGADRSFACLDLLPTSDREATDVLESHMQNRR